MSHYAKTHAAQPVGLSGEIIDVEVDVTKGSLHAFSVVGLPDKAVEESRDRISSAIKHAGFKSPKHQNQKIIISLAPADLKKTGPLFDLSMAIGYLQAVEEISFDTDSKLFLGELALDGTLRPMHGTLVLAQEARRNGFTELFVPQENAKEAALVEGITVYGAPSLSAVIRHLDPSTVEDGREYPALSPQPSTPMSATHIAPPNAPDFRDVRGQESAKRGLEIAAAGGHNVCMYGPPGTGKTMLARCFAGILPQLSFADALEVTSVHSLAGTLKGTLMTHPPFRAPHHTSSYTSIVGGGTIPKPGEITLAHKGVLFTDEFPEFDKRVLESLRQPLEDGVIHISRVRGTETFPANIILIAAMNPCPCGNKGSQKICSCTPSTLAKYERKISGPIMDRIDLWMEVGHIEHTALSEAPTGEASTEMRKRVSEARNTQHKRLAKHKRSVNADMDTKTIDKTAHVSAEATQVLQSAARTLSLSPRGYHKVVKVARTIADLDGAEWVGKQHITEALSYRPKQEV